MIKSGLFPEEAQKLKDWMALPKEERPSIAQIAKRFRVNEKVIRNFFPKTKAKAGRDRQVKVDNPSNT